MKKYNLLIIAIITLILISSCSMTIVSHKIECELSTEMLFIKIKTVLLQEGFIIKADDIESGYLHAETQPKINILSRQSIVKSWVIQVDGKNIIAYAKVNTTSQNAFGAIIATSETYIGNSKTRYANKEAWYKNIKEKLEKICKNRIIIQEIERPR